MKISIYSVYHKPSFIIKNAVIKPIQVGFSNDILDIDFRDNSGADNIYEKNDTYCELTAQYWMWKNDLSSDFVGLMHYRRFFDFSEQKLEPNQLGILEKDGFTLDFENTCGLSETDIQRCIEGQDIILPVEWNVGSAGWKDVRSNYAKSPFHHLKDLQVVEDVIKEFHPQYLEFFEAHMGSKMMCATNMFVMRRDLFDQYCTWLFAVLHELEKRIDITSYDEQERRVFGYLAERLLNVWILKVQRDQPGLKIKYLNRIFIKDTLHKNWKAPLPITDKPLVSTVIASDNNYVPHLGALIKSIQHHFSDENYLDLIILDGGISHLNRKLLVKLAQEHANTSISFIELKHEFAEHQTHMHFTKATFYRLILSQLISDRDRLLYIDCDTIVLDDIAKLYNQSLNGKAIGAVFDYIMHHFCQNRVRSMSDVGGMESKEYLMDYVGMKSNWDAYFQAGVLLLDMKKIKALDFSSLMIDDLLSKKYWFLDQDILNKYFQNNVLFVEPRWNFVNCGKEIYKGLNSTQVKALEQASENPAIIHYAGFEVKPWNNMRAAFAEYYFYFLRQTYWYEDVMNKLKVFDRKKVRAKTFKYRLVKALWTAIPKKIRNNFRMPRILWQK